MRPKVKRFGKAFLIASAIVLTSMAMGCSSDKTPAEKAAQNWLQLPEEGKDDICLGLELFGAEGVLEMTEADVGYELDAEKTEMFHEMTKIAEDYCND